MGLRSGSVCYPLASFFFVWFWFYLEIRRRFTTRDTIFQEPFFLPFNLLVPYPTFILFSRILHIWHMHFPQPLYYKEAL